MSNIPTFPVNFRNPDYGLEGSPTFLVDKVTLGDRVERRIKRGINNKYYSWNLVWNNLSFYEEEELREFLEGLEGVFPFLWTHPTNNRLYKVTCEEFSITEDVHNRRNFSVTFVEDV